ncbi:MAG: 3-hydroxyacyl-ACP dehydratase [Crocinitomicaceae bacterium]|nr:MAG: 3-hydroxyacyl-ACP dehydratase [Crocinitomicaceae bacterium]
MILNDTFYTVTELTKGENTLDATIKLNAAHAIFEGHFPNNPVTPGVVEMEIVKEILSLGLEKPLKMKTMSSCKFLAVLNPINVENVQVKISITEMDDAFVRISGQLADDTTSFLKIAATYAIL